MPRLARVAVLINPDNPAIVPEFTMMEMTARSLNVTLQPLWVRGPREFMSAFETMDQKCVEAVETSDDPVFTGNVWSPDGMATRERLLSIGPKEVATSARASLGRD